MSWEPVNVEPIKTDDGNITVPNEVIESMKRNKVGLKGILRDISTLQIMY